MALTPLPGYVSIIWNAIKAALSTASSGFNLTNPTASAALTQATAQSVRNGVMAIDAFILSQGLLQAATNLAAVLALPVVLDPTTTMFITNAITALQAAAASAATLIVIPTTASALSQGAPTIPDPMLIEWMMAFNFATPPTGLTAANFADQAEAAATAWQTLVTALTTQGINFNGQTFNAVNQILQSATVTAFEVSQMTISAQANLTMAWNLIVMLPTLSRVASLIYSNPTSASSQQIAAIRNAGLTALQQFQQLLVSFQTTAPSQVATAQVRLGDSLMDIAARELGDFNQWSNIAQLNGLVPPYTAAVSSPGVAGPGTMLFLPTGSPLPAVGVPPPNYNVNVLGTDKFLGPLNEDMLTWTGDFQLITGIPNLQISLGRRLQTTLGTLIYHETFGSRIPPEVGDVEASTTGLLIEAYAESALQADPRVQSVQTITLTTPQVNQVNIAATVIPIGSGSGAGDININQVIQPI
jgi:phage baseplate assembly protein W